VQVLQWDNEKQQWRRAPDAGNQSNQYWRLQLAISITLVIGIWCSAQLFFFKSLTSIAVLAGWHAVGVSQGGGAPYVQRQEHAAQLTRMLVGRQGVVNNNSSSSRIGALVFLHHCMTVLLWSTNQ
jgi:hypothetical protein